MKTKPEDSLSRKKEEKKSDLTSDFNLERTADTVNLNLSHIF